MRLANADTGEVLDPLSADEAKTLTESIRSSVADLEGMVVRAYFGRAWLPMGYDSWDDYVQGEFKSAPLMLPREDRRVQVASLRQQGLSLPAIAAATGVSVGTVHNDAQAFKTESLPERVTGTDGKDYAASRPVPESRGPWTCDTHHSSQAHGIKCEHCEAERRSYQSFTSLLISLPLVVEAVANTTADRILEKSEQHPYYELLSPDQLDAAADTCRDLAAAMRRRAA